MKKKKTKNKKKKQKNGSTSFFPFLSYFEKNGSYVNGMSVCIFLALYVGIFVARANKVEGTMS